MIQICQQQLCYYTDKWRLHTFHNYAHNLKIIARFYDYFNNKVLIYVNYNIGLAQIKTHKIKTTYIVLK